MSVGVLDRQSLQDRQVASAQADSRSAWINAADCSMTGPLAVP